MELFVGDYCCNSNNEPRKSAYVLDNIMISPIVSKKLLQWEPSRHYVMHGDHKGWTWLFRRSIFRLMDHGRHGTSVMTAISILIHPLVNEFFLMLFLFHN